MAGFHYVTKDINIVRRSQKYLFLGAQHGMFVNFGANFLKRVHPYESKNIIPQNHST